MTNPIIKIHNVETGEEVERQMTADEMAQRKIDQESVAAIKEEVVNLEIKKLEVLAKLGLTADEVTALLA